jgi:crotonobetainyl-CoA:carnitine CoA-transferase CaiB-like acyl-CoA transferase
VTQDPAEPVDAGSVEPPLADVFVADFSRVLAGPLAAMTLGDLGADVVKLEAVGGLMSVAGPPGAPILLGFPARQPTILSRPPKPRRAWCRDPDIARAVTACAKALAVSL